MLSLAWEDISTTYSLRSIAIQANLNPSSYYIFQSPCEHKLLTTLKESTTYSGVTITRAQLQNLLSFLELKEREERKDSILKDQNLGYYYDPSRSDGSHTMYSLRCGMGGLTLCKPKNGRHPNELTPEQVKDLKMALIKKRIILDY